ncbi:Coatomer subunit beta [Hondaea fermentalgiana]|uniref:Coatomer subunit beta n=1 Tax=Hondaea fermentalgiana TaxID=2315210 RepID=A0A2R5GL03_9STRA|nr:Coatomer subunit beta [Hondaea fermentalgiana]|eukprot:GBG29303.1 Coatomer subunit beta [Hondaea fermentalgiana]
MTTMERNCTLLIHMDKGMPPTAQEIQEDLESGKPGQQVRGLKTLILLLLNGESLPKLLMTVIRYCVPSQDHEVKKLVSLYWECVEKYGEDGKLREEMILMCNALLMNLKHPNEFIRGYTLRFLCRVKEADIVEPLVAAVKENLEHRHAYVRKYAVMAVYTIFKNFGDDLMPDADDLIETFLKNEADASARRNAFLMLYQCSQEKAIDYFVENVENVQKYGDGFQLVILELTRKVCRTNPAQKSRFIKIIFQLLQSQSSAVCYEAAWTLVSLSSAPTAVRAAAETYTMLLNAESDNNVKLIVLEKLMEMRRHHSKILQGLLMDIMRALASPNADIRRKTLAISMELVSPRNINEVVLMLKKEILKTQSKDMDRESAAEYRQMLVKAIHQCAIRFANVASSVVHLLLDFLSSEGAINVILFVREIVAVYTEMRASVVSKLIEALPDIKTAQVYRVALWILGEYTDTDELRREAIESIYACFGELPFVGAEARKHATEDGEEDDDDEASKPVAQVLAKTQTKVTVLADGTYATQTALTSAIDEDELGSSNSDPTLRKLMLKGNYLLGAAAVASLMKIVLRMRRERGAEDDLVKRTTVKLLMTCCSMVQAGKVAKGPMRLDKDSYERISFVIRTLLDPTVLDEVETAVLDDCRRVFTSVIEHERKALRDREADAAAGVATQPDDLILFRQLKARRALGTTDVDLDDEASLSRAAGMGDGSDFAEQLAHVHQLTGFSDPVYAETQVTVHDYDIVLDILVINRTPNTLSNLTVELSTMGDLRLVERPQSYNIGPNSFRRFKANIKVSSTETGQIFGNIVYDSSTSSAHTVINLNEIPIEIMDYIKPATCSDAAFRSMWAEFEWENKVAVNTLITDVDEYLDHIIASTNMKCLSRGSTKANGPCNFLAANLYARSVFGEDALVNVSIEAVGGTVTGFCRIRAKAQGIALSLGDRVTFMQKTNKQ